MKAAFFDRDGVLNKELGRYVTHADEFKLNPWVIPFMKKLHENGYVFFVITNQGGISKGLYTQNDLFGIHDKLTRLLKAENITIKEIFYCPHHPLHSRCLCRKPDNLMLQKAIAKYGVDTSTAFMVGDSDRDVEAAQLTGIFPIHVIPNHPPQPQQLKDLSEITGIDFDNG